MDNDDESISNVDLLNTLRAKQYTVTISPILYDKFNRHLLFLKKLCQVGQTKQKWLMEAIHEKLQREKNSTEGLPERRINIKIDVLTLKKVSERIDFIRKFRTSYSKKQWIADAIEEKLEIEKNSVTKKINEHREAYSNSQNE